jgi:hypothetical protein
MDAFDAPEPDSIFSGPLAEAVLWDPPTFTDEGDGLYISPEVNRRGARGAMVALGLEAAAVLACVGVWMLVRMVF